MEPAELDLSYLATCVLEELIDYGSLPRMEDEEQGKSTDEWALAHAAAVAALQRGLAHLAQEGGEAGIAHPCDRCGASPAHLFDHTPLEEHGTWERLCNACIDKELEPWQGPVATEVQP